MSPDLENYSFYLFIAILSTFLGSFTVANPRGPVLVDASGVRTRGRSGMPARPRPVG